LGGGGLPKRLAFAPISEQRHDRDADPEDFDQYCACVWAVRERDQDQNGANKVQRLKRRLICGQLFSCSCKVRPFNKERADDPNGVIYGKVFKHSPVF